MGKSKKEDIEAAGAGVSIYAFFRNMIAGHGASDAGRIEAAYIHTNFVKMVSLSSAGVEVEE